LAAVHRQAFKERKCTRMIDIRYRSKSNGVPVLSKVDMDSIAEFILRDYNEKVLSEPYPLDIDRFAEFYVGLQMDYQDLTHNQSILGMMVFNNCKVPVYDASKQEAKYISVSEGTALIDNSLLDEDQRRRGRFTVGHETSHWIFHRKKYRRKNENQLSLFGGIEDKTKPVIICKTVNVEGIAQKNNFSTDENWIEWQADYMSSALLMPKVTFTMVVQNLFKKVGIQEGFYVKGQDSDLDIWVGEMPRYLADIFDVSIQAATIRLKALNFIRGKTATQQGGLFFS